MKVPVTTCVAMDFDVKQSLRACSGSEMGCSVQASTAVLSAVVHYRRMTRPCRHLITTHHCQKRSHTIVDVFLVANKL